MSKLLVVKQDAKAFNAYFADDSTQGYYRVSDCANVDIDELMKDYINHNLIVNGFAIGFELRQLFSEYLQERMK